MGDALNSSFGVTMQATTGAGGNVIGVGGFQLCNTPVVSLNTGYCKTFYRILLFPIFLLFYLFCIY